MIVVLMGVMGSGKTAIGKRLADLMSVDFIDADDHHPVANKEKMRSGQPLDDGDRQPWLEILNGLMRGWRDAGAGGVLACSALKESYREVLRSGLPSEGVVFVLLDATQELLAERLSRRRHEYMNNALLESQLATLERPQDALVIMNDRAPEDIARDILRGIEARVP